MYAHQVIEDLKKTKTYFNLNEGFSRIIDISINSINMSHQFHFDSVSTESLQNIGKKENRMFKMGDTIVKTPFKYCWFDFDCKPVPNYKLGVCVLSYLASEIDRWKIDQYGIISFLKGKENDGLWQVAPKTVFVNDGIVEDYFCAPTKIHSAYLDVWIGFCITLVHKALLLLNCKNISTEKNYPPEALNRKRIKQGKQPLFTYHTLVVNPMREKKRSDGEHEQTGIKQRLHFCRGHFKEYTESNKLFGKHTGLYWWQPMVRGNKELGLVHKDYEVRAA
jgi:hypothetical protein